MLGSGDIDVHLNSTAERDAILRGPGVDGMAIIRQDRLVEIMGVPKDLVVIQPGRQGDNQDLMKGIE